MRWGEMSWTDLSEIPEASVIILPTGSCEQHGPHLPLLTDSMIVTEVAERLERAMPDVVCLLPTLWVGASGHHLEFPGTISHTETLYMQLIKHLLESILDSGVCGEGRNRRILILNSHGGNSSPTRAIMSEMARERRNKPPVWIVQNMYLMMDPEKFAAIKGEFASPGMTHACEYETSLILAIKRDVVRLDRARAETSTFVTKYIAPDIQKPSKVYASLPIEQRSATGAFGMPQDGTAEKGEKILELCVDELSNFITDFLTWDDLPRLGPKP